MKVRVSQETGQITIQTGGAKARVYNVHDHVVSVAADYLEQFLAAMPGSHVVDEPRPQAPRKAK